MQNLQPSEWQWSISQLERYKTNGCKRAGGSIPRYISPVIIVLQLFKECFCGLILGMAYIFILFLWLYLNTMQTQCLFIWEIILTTGHLISHCLNVYNMKL